jgi:hypothetical protein
MENEQMTYVYSDGGRAASGFKGTTGDCVVRAVAIAAGLPYSDVYDTLSRLQRSQRVTKHTRKGAGSLRNGTYTKRKWFKDYMVGLGFEWVPTMQIGTGCKVHLRGDELPPGRLVVMLSRHACAVIDGAVHDAYDSTRGGTRCVYGYWKKS